MSALFAKRTINRSLNRLVDFIFPSPVGGLNTTTSYDSMPLNEAIVMDNYIPYTDKIDTEVTWLFQNTLLYLHSTMSLSDIYHNFGIF